ncbi:MAG: heme exporter protein CcmD [Rhodobacterales bacterium]
MPDLGKYTDTVLLAYIVSLTFLIGFCALTWMQSRRAKKRLATEEARHEK